MAFWYRRPAHGGIRDGSPPMPYVPAAQLEHAPVVATPLHVPAAHTVQPDAGTAPHPALPAQNVVVTFGVPE